MITTGTPVLAASLAFKAANDSAAAGAQASAGEGSASSPSVKVTLSPLAAHKSETSRVQDDDIQKSDLPDAVKETLMRIRELKREIAEKTAQLQAALNDTSLEPEAQQARVAALQTAVVALNTALTSSNAALLKAYKQMTPEQVKAATLLAMKG